MDPTVPPSPGGLASGPPAVPNAVGGRDAAYSLVAISDPHAAQFAG